MIIRIFTAREPAKPLNDAQMCGSFLYIYVHSQNTLMERLPHSMKAYERTVECFKLLNRSQFATSSAISSLVSRKPERSILRFTASFLVSNP